MMGEQETETRLGTMQIELTDSEKRYRIILGAAAIKVDDDNEGQSALDETEDDELMSCGNDSDCNSLQLEPSWGASTNRISSNLLLIVSVVLATVFFTYQDKDVIKESETEEGHVLQKVPYSYQGYKDARIPDDDDDDDARYGGALFVEPFKTGEHYDNDSGGKQIEQSPSDQSTFHEHTGIPRIDSLWQKLERYAEMEEPRNVEHESPLFWHVPKSGGNTLQDLLLTCYGMIGANEMGAKYSKETLEIVRTDNGIRYVNVDLSSPAGISDARERGFGMSGLADVVVTSWLHQVASLFDSDHKGRCFTLLRHPIQRAISLFYYLHDNDPMFKNMSIIEYTTSLHAEENWLVRFLNNEMSGALDDRHLDQAKEVLASKCLVGLTEEFTLSFERFDAYFKWSETEFGGPISMNDRGACVTRIINNPENARSHPMYDEGDDVWNLLMKKNQLDLKLYEYAIHLFHDVQGNLVERQ